MSKKVKQNLARDFRKKPTKSEKIMWNVLRNRNFLNLKFRRQHLIKGYLLDFYCHELKLAVEIDGWIHNNQKDKDNIRQNVIECSGVTFYRINSEQVELNLNMTLKDLATYVKKISLPKN